MYEIWSGPRPKVRFILLLEYQNTACLILNIYTDALPLMSRGVRYHEPEHWKFGDDGNKYFRHATGQLYAISKDLATYVAINK